MIEKRTSQQYDWKRDGKQGITMKLITILSMIALVGCTNKALLKENIKEVLKANPEIIVETMEENPVEFMEALQKIAKESQSALAKKRENDEKKQMEKLYDNPLKPAIRKDEAIRGDKNAPITLVEYSDFECPYCSRGYKTVNDLIKKYGSKIRFIYKHLPLDFHAQAKISALYFEAIRLQNEEKAFKFHDKIFESQKKLSLGEPFLKRIAKDLNVNMKKLAKDIKRKDLSARIDQDIAEANKFGIRGTPGFVINGIPVKGAYPASHFEDIVAELKKRGKLKL